MLGGIYTEQKCPVCFGLFKDDGKRGLFCPKHPDQYATNRFYEEASRLLNGFRYKTDEGTFDSRDYKKDNPLGFANLAGKWLQIKKREVKPKSYNNLKNYVSRACNAWGNRNIKSVGYAELEDFLLDQDVRRLFEIT